MFETYQGLKKADVCEMWGEGGCTVVVVAHGLHGCKQQTTNKIELDSKQKLQKQG